MVSDGGQGPWSGPGEGRRNRNRVLIVSSSPINRIVISRTVEAIYLKPVAVTPSEALRALGENEPMMVIIEQEASEDALKPLLSELARKRGEGPTPRTILVGAPLADGQVQAPEGLFDAVIPKPMTPDSLQPVIERLCNTGGA